MLFLPSQSRNASSTSSIAVHGSSENVWLRLRESFSTCKLPSAHSRPQLSIPIATIGHCIESDTATLQLPWYCLRCVLYSRHHFRRWQRSRRPRLRLYLSNRLGLCNRHRIRHHHLRPCLWWPLQPRHHTLLRYLAGLPMAQSPPLHFLSDLWRLHRRPAIDGLLLARDPDRKGT
jgi:hypothetical protein